VEGDGSGDRSDGSRTVVSHVCGLAAGVDRHGGGFPTHRYGVPGVLVVGDTIRRSPTYSSETRRSFRTSVDRYAAGRAGNLPPIAAHGLTGEDLGGGSPGRVGLGHAGGIGADRGVRMGGRGDTGRGLGALGPEPWPVRLLLPASTRITARDGLQRLS
jgi:hypothetical protein